MVGKQSRPFVVGTLVGKNSLESQIQKALNADLDFLEVRLDTFPQAYHSLEKIFPFSKNLIDALNKRVKKPIILTFRTPLERGEKPSHKEKIVESKRLLILKILIPLVPWVDLEIRSNLTAKILTSWAALQKTRVIHSYHDFKKADQFTNYKSASESSIKLKGDIFKLAVYPSTNDELEAFLKFSLSLENKKLCLIGMGKTGLISRFLGFSFGSLFTYGHLGVSAAPGQIPASQLSKLLKNTYPLSEM
jgi:3-dehydroquinate dehydratase-1